MKSVLVKATMLAALLAVGGLCSAHATPSKGPSTKATDKNAAAQTVVLDVQGMHCEGCASAVQTALSKTSGVQKAVVSKAKNQATVTYDPKKTSVPKLIDAVKNAQGMAPYTAKEHKS
jgi:copper chaperone CopZ